MKARIKETGEIINIAEYAIVKLDKCDSYGNPIEMPFESVEILQDKSDDIDWEQRHYDLAKNFTAVMLGRLKKYIANYNCCSSDVNPYRVMAEIAVKTSDALIAELKKGEQNDNTGAER